MEAEEVAEDVGLGQKKYEEPGPRGSAADFLTWCGNGGRSVGMTYSHHHK